MITPLFKVRDMRAALRHYTEILDFIIADPNDHAGSPVVDLEKDGSMLQLTVMERDSLFGSVANVWVKDVDAIFNKYKQRGLDASGREDSPVHQGPVDQSWQRREFYVTDEDGNTLRFMQVITGH